MSARLRAAVEIYFEAKSRMFADVADFRLLRVGPLRCFHCHPNWPEVDAFYALDVSPTEVVEAVRTYQPHPHHMVTVFAPSAQPYLAGFEERGYRSDNGPGQPLMHMALETQASLPDGFHVQKVQNAADMEFINSMGEVMKPSHLNGGVFSYYFIEQEGRPVCTGRYVWAPHQAMYVAGMDTHPDYRRRGLATALMCRMHSDAAAEGVTQSVLCSSPSGLALYQKSGYELITRMHRFVPHE